jgi:adenine/guanine phosphoribosyltransferase-like PRPP-binding protein
MEALCRVRDQFAKQPICQDGDTAPRVYFNITDFAAPLSHTVIDDIAACMADAVQFGHADAVVSIADRSSGCIAHEVARLAGLPYTLANWYPAGMPGEVQVQPCAGFSGGGHIWLNGLKRGKKVVVVLDILKTGRTAGNIVTACLRAGCVVTNVVFAGELVEYGGREHPELCEHDVSSLVRVHVRGERTKEVHEDDTFLPTTAAAAAGGSAPTPARIAALIDGNDALRVAELRAVDPRSAAIRALRQATAQERAAKMSKITSAFVNIPIVNNPELCEYPYCFFQLTDFNPMMVPDVVEEMADLMVMLADFERCDVIVSEADRGGAPLAQAVARRTGRPFVLANWYPLGEGIGASTSVNVGFSGDGSVHLNGISEGDRCIFVDDMLSSGGTAEGVLGSIVKLGGIPVECVFASEKLYPPKTAASLPFRKGIDRLATAYPQVTMTTLVQFVVQGARTFAPHERIG